MKCYEPLVPYVRFSEPLHTCLVYLLFFKISIFKFLRKLFFYINCREIDVYESNGMRQSSRAERRPMLTASVSTNLKQIKGSLGDHSNKATAALIWPIDVSRLAPSETVRKAGRVN